MVSSTGTANGNCSEVSAIEDTGGEAARKFFPEDTPEIKTVKEMHLLALSMQL